MLKTNAVSVTEILDYLRCQRQWDYQSKNRMGLTPLDRAPLSLFVGTFLHEVLEEALLGHSWMTFFNSVLDAKRQEYRLKYHKKVGTFPSDAEEEAALLQPAMTVYNLLNHYFQHYGLEPFKPMDIVDTNVAFAIPIPGTDGYLKGRFDAIATDVTGTMWVIDHKTYSSTPAELQALFDDHQFNFYVWALQRLYPDAQVGGLLYDGISKTVPVSPKQNLDGRFSRQLIATTWETYKEAVTLAGQDPRDYEDMRVKLLEKPTAFFTRHSLALQPDEQVYGELLAGYYNAMQATEVILPNRRWEGCWDCDFKDLCRLQYAGKPLDEGLSNYDTASVPS